MRPAYYQDPLVRFSESTPSQRLYAMDGRSRRKAAIADRDDALRSWGGKPPVAWAMRPRWLTFTALAAPPCLTRDKDNPFFHSVVASPRHWPAAPTTGPPPMTSNGVM